MMVRPLISQKSKIFDSFSPGRSLCVGTDCHNQSADWFRNDNGEVALPGGTLRAAFPTGWCDTGRDGEPVPYIVHCPLSIVNYFSRRRSGKWEMCAFSLAILAFGGYN